MKLPGTIGYSELVRRLGVASQTVAPLKDSDQPTVGHALGGNGEAYQILRDGGPMLDALITYLQGRLDKGLVKISDLQLSADRRPDIVHGQLRGLLYSLKDSVESVARDVGLGKVIGPGVADEIRGAAQLRNVSPEMFQAACEQQYLQFISYRQLGRADQLAEAFSTGDLSFDPKKIPSKILDAAIAEARDSAKGYLYGDYLQGSLDFLNALVERKLLGKKELEADLQAVVARLLAGGSPLPEPLEPYRKLVKPEALVAERRKVAEHLLDLVRHANFESLHYSVQIPADKYDDLAPKLAVLNSLVGDKIISQAELKEALTTGYLHQVRYHGADSRWAVALEPLVKPDPDQLERALDARAYTIAHQPYNRDEWFATALEHKHNFPHDAPYPEVMRDMAYYALATGQPIPKGVTDAVGQIDPKDLRFRLAACNMSFFVELPTGNREKKWVNLRDEVHGKVKGETERKLGHLLCDYLGQTSAHYSISEALEKLPEILALATKASPPPGGNYWHQRDAALADRARQYFGASVPQNAWKELAGLRQQIDQIMRSYGVSIDPSKKD